ncbi:hypothetical protein ACIQWI_00380 [Peribacillus frigoritolerans]
MELETTPYDDTDLTKLKSGTTNGILYTLHNNEIPKYVIKIDQPKIIATTVDFLLTYKDVNLVPNVLYTDEKKEFIVYSYISGETHFNRGSKVEWMTILIKELLNKYKKVNHNKMAFPTWRGLVFVISNFFRIPPYRCCSPDFLFI